MKKLFKNYNLELDKNSRKLLSGFTKQALKQFEGNQKFYVQQRVFASVIDKLNDPSDSVKLTKEEFTQLSFSLKENVKFLKGKSEQGWFFKKWMYKNLYIQYNTVYTNYFMD
jgi:hypothetical protein